MLLRLTLLVRVFGVMASCIPLGLGGVVQAEQPYQIEWTRVFGADRGDSGSGVAVDNNGLIYISGVTGFRDDAFLAQYDAGGNQQWLSTLGSGQDDGSLGLTIDSSGKPIISGYTFGDLAAPNAGFSDTIIAKYDSLGAVQWVRQTGNSYYDPSHALVADTQDNIYVTRTGNTIPGYGLDGIVDKYNADGEILWSRSFATPADDRLYATDLDSQGNLLLAGYTRGVIGEQSIGGADAYVVTFTENGDKGLSLQFGSSTHDWAEGIAADDGGNFYVTGKTQGQLADVSYGGEDAFLVKFNSAGEMVWSRQLGTSAHDGANAITLDKWGNIFITGYTLGTFPGETQTSNGDMFLAKFDESGTLLWVDQYSAGNGTDQGMSVASDSTGNIYVSGQADWSGSTANILLMKYSVPEPTSITLFMLSGLMLLRRIGDRPPNPIL